MDDVHGKTNVFEGVDNEEIMFEDSRIEITSDRCVSAFCVDLSESCYSLLRVWLSRIPFLHTGCPKKIVPRLHCCCGEALAAIISICSQ